MNIDNDEGTKSGALQLGELSSHKHHSFLKLIIKFLEIFAQTLNSLFNNSFLNLSRPVYLRSIEDALTWMNEDPISSWFLQIILNGIKKDSTDTSKHHALNFSHPIFDTLISGVDRLEELDLLLLTRVHGNDGFVRLELEISHVFEDLSQMRSHILNFFSLRQDFEQLIVRQEIESGEDRSLGLQILSETSLDEVKVPVSLLELLEETLSCARL